MTAYVALRAADTGVGSIGVLAVTYQMRIAKIEIIGGSSAYISIHRYSGAGLSGGTSITPRALREGAPASTATSKYSATISGTGSVMHSSPAGDLNYDPPFELLVSAGSALFIVCSSLPGGTTVTGSGILPIYMAVYYEELRLNWSS